MAHLDWEREAATICRHVREHISANLDGEASDALGPEAASHLVSCGACREFEENAASVTRQLRLRLLEPAPDLCEQILARIEAEPPTMARRSRRRRQVRAPSMARWAAALVPLALATSGLASNAFAATHVVPTCPVTTCTAALRHR